MDWYFDADGPIDAEITVPAGEIQLEEGTTDKISVVLEPAGHSSPQRDEIIAAAEVTFSDGRLHVRVPERSSKEWDIGGHKVVLSIPGINFGTFDVYCRVVLPPSSSVSTRTSSADVNCTARLRSLRATTASGDISFGEVEDAVVVKAASGDVEGDSAGSLQVTGASSDVRIARVVGEARISTASGDVTLSETQSSVTVKTASGDVHLSRATSGRVNINTASGDVTLGVARGVAAHLDVTSVSGDMSCDVPVEDSSLTDAELEIICRTVSGDVRIEAAR